MLICPIMSKPVNNNEFVELHDIYCYKEKCACYDTRVNLCGLNNAAMVRNLEDIAYHLSDK